MLIKFPKYVVREIFRRVARKAVEKNNSSGLLMNSRCEVCDDKKARMYLVENSDGYQVFCHKCNYSVSFYNYLVEQHPEEVDKLKEHIVESYREKFAAAQVQTQIIVNKFCKRIDKEQQFYINTNDKLSNYLDNYAFFLLKTQTNTSFESFRLKCIERFESRRIPMEIYKDFRCFYKGPYRGYVAIPFFDPHNYGLIEHVQGIRMFKPPVEEESYYPKYKFLKDADVGIELKEKPFWGTWRLDFKKNVILAEGTLDAMAFYNGVSTCTATLSTYFLDEVSRTFPNRTWAVDNFFIDKAGRRLTEKLLMRGEKCFIIPKDIRMSDGDYVKDGNDLLKALNLNIIPNEYVEQNTYHGKIGLMKLKMLADDNTSYTKVFDDPPEPKQYPNKRIDQ